MTENNPVPPVTPPTPDATPTDLPAPSKDDVTMGMLCHLLGIFTMWLGPLILWLVKKDSSKYVDAQGKEALNYQITWTIICILCIIPICIAWILIPVAQIIRIVFSVIGTIKAGKGEMYRYPMTFRFIK